MTVSYPDERSAKVVLGAVGPEEASVPSRRTRVGMRRKGREIDLRIEAEDSTSMRAAINSYLRWMILAEKILRIAGDGPFGK